MEQIFENNVWPEWEVVRKLGEGTFGGVYEIQRTLPDGRIEKSAMKRLMVPKDASEIEELYAQNYDNNSITAHYQNQMRDLVREYSLMQELGENPNVVHCYDLKAVQHQDGIGWDLFIRMELLTPLRKGLSAKYDEETTIRLGQSLCSALIDCHQKNILHRDIKPENILMTENGRFKLGDFGVAKVSEKTATGTLTGSYGYMAPEIANHQHYGTAADIYSLGLVMYWMMNERTLPFLPLGKQIPSAVQKQEATNRRLSGETIPAPANGSPELKRIVLKACAFSPDERYHTARELYEDLSLLQNDCTSDTATIAKGPEPKRARSSTKRMIAAVLAAVIILGGAVLAIINRTYQNSSAEENSMAVPPADNRPEALLGTWYSFYSLTELSSLTSDPSLELSEDGAVYSNISGEPMAWSVQNDILTIPDFFDDYTVLNINGIYILKGKYQTLISKDTLENHLDEILKPVTLTKDNLLDYFAYCTATIDEKDAFGELSGNYNRYIYLRPKEIPGYVFWGEAAKDWVSIKVEIPEHSYRTRTSKTNQSGTIHRNQKEEKIISFYPYQVARLIGCYDGRITEYNLNPQSDFSILNAKGTILFLNEAFFQEWIAEKGDYSYISLQAKDIFGRINYIGQYVLGVAPNTTEHSAYDLTVEPFDNENDVSAPVQEADHDCPGTLACFSAEKGTKMKLVCLLYGDYEKTIDAVPLTQLSRKQQDSALEPVISTDDNVFGWKMSPNTERKVTFKLDGKYKYLALRAGAQGDSLVTLEMYIDGVLVSSDDISDRVISDTITGAKELEIRITNHDGTATALFLGCVAS